MSAAEQTDFQQVYRVYPKTHLRLVDDAFEAIEADSAIDNIRSITRRQVEGCVDGVFEVVVDYNEMPDPTNDEKSLAALEKHLKVVDIRTRIPRTNPMDDLSALTAGRGARAESGAKVLTLEERGIDEALLGAVNDASEPPIGRVADYIGELAEDIEGADDTAIAMATVNDGDYITVGNVGPEVLTSIQSVIKPFLFLYALHRGYLADDISGGEAAARPFNRDPITEGRDETTAKHALNNAGGISSAGAIDNWDDFLGFMRDITGNPTLGVMEDVYQSEKADWQGNHTIAQALAGGGRFHGNSNTEMGVIETASEEATRALDNYTKACSIGFRIEDLVEAGLTLARMGKNKHGNQVVNRDHCIEVMAAMNMFGFYENTGRTTKGQAGTLPLTAKTGVGGLMLNVNPEEGVFVTRGRRLDSMGNTVHGTIAGMALNPLMGRPGSEGSRFGPEAQRAYLEAYLERESTVLTAMYVEEVAAASNDEEKRRIRGLYRLEVGALRRNIRENLERVTAAEVMIQEA